MNTKRPRATVEERMDHAATRQHPRLPLRMPVFCESPAVSGYRTVGLTQNVSRDGLLLEVPQPLAAGTPINLLLLTGDHNARAEAVVVWKAEDPPSRMGLKFTALTGGDLATWERLLVLQAGPTPRASVRLPIALEVACRIPPDMRVTGQAENISEGGLQLAVGQGLSPRTLLTVEIPPWFTLPAVEAEMEVVWNRSAPTLESVLHGLRFCSDDIGKELFLIGALLRQLVDSDEATPEGEGEQPLTEP